MKDYHSSFLFYYILFYVAVITLFQDKETNNFSGVFVGAWKQCTVEEGGGICPDGNTCCPTSSGPGTRISSCISSRNVDEGRPGQCCDLMGKTGCGYGYKCDTIHFQQQDNEQEEEEEQEQEQICRLLEPHIPHFNAPITPRYQLCQVSSFSGEALTLQGFPIQSFPQTPTVPTTDGDEKHHDGDVDADVDDTKSVQVVLPYFNATYYSNMGNILSTTTEDGVGDDTDTDNNKFEKIETVLIIVHGTGMNADEYLCTGMSLIDEDKKDQTLVIATKFLVDAKAGITLATEYFDDDFYLTAMKEKVKEDLDVTVEVENPLHWADVSSHPHAGRSFRYGSEALNTYDNNGSSRNGNGKKNETLTSGISSYDVMDQLLEYILTSTKTFPAVTRIVVMGHSAGGQYVQRWSLLSNSSIIWDHHNDDNRKIDIRVVPANPRSYAYLDNRRMIRQQQKREQQQQQSQSQLRQNNDNTVTYEYVFDVPHLQDIDSCPSYNQWEWGFDEDVVDVGMKSPYRDRALETSTATDIALHYGTQRQVQYLVGGNDTIDFNHDGCEQYNHNFQGYTRNERGHHYYQALTHYFAANNSTSTTTTSANTTTSTSIDMKDQLLHQFFEVPFSPHDHTIMFQSQQGREAIFGTTTIHNNNNDQDWDYGNEIQWNAYDSSYWVFSSYMSSSWLYGLLLVVVVVLVVFIVMMIVKKKKNSRSSPTIISIYSQQQQQQQKYNDNNNEDIGFEDEPNGRYVE